MNNKTMEKRGDLLEVLAAGIMDIRAELAASRSTTEKNESLDEPVIRVTVNRQESVQDELAPKASTLDQIVEEIGKRKEELDALSDMIELANKELLDAKEALLETQARASAAQIDLDECVRSENQALEERKLLEGRTLELDERESNLIEREQCADDAFELIANSKNWVKSLLPKWSEEDDFSPMCKEMIADVKGSVEPQSACAGLLATTLAGYSFALREPDDRNLADAVRDVGRRLFTWMRIRGADVSQSTELARTVAAHINMECSGRCDVEVPTPGGPAQNQTMLFQPRPGTSDQTVVTVQSWCVRGPKREVIHRASINL